MNDKLPKNTSVDIDVDLIIEKLLSVRGSKPGKLVSLTENEIRGLCLKCRDIFASQPILLEIEAPLKICGKLIFQKTIYKNVKVMCMDNTMIY